MRSLGWDSGGKRGSEEKEDVMGCVVPLDTAVPYGVPAPQTLHQLVCPAKDTGSKAEGSIGGVQEGPGAEELCV